MRRRRDRRRGTDAGAQTPGHRRRGTDAGAQTPGHRRRGTDAGAQTPGHRRRGTDAGAQTPGHRRRGTDAEDIEASERLLMNTGECTVVCVNQNNVLSLSSMWGVSFLFMISVGERGVGEGGGGKILPALHNICLD